MIRRLWDLVITHYKLWQLKREVRQLSTLAMRRILAVLEVAERDRQQAEGESDEG